MKIKRNKEMNKKLCSNNKNKSMQPGLVEVRLNLTEVKLNVTAETATSYTQTHYITQ